MQEWWRTAVIYHVYVRSFFDSNGDGIGDLAGLTWRLDYLQWLGIDAIWCSPLTVSSNHDLGYDVVDYLDVDPTLGTMEDFERLISEADRRGIRVIMDLVPNHTSSSHPWFLDPQTRRDYYIWTDEPNNWVSTFHLSMWTAHPEDGDYYLHSYLPQQPDLNWRNPAVRAEFDRIMRFWLDRGVAGFRIDACYLLLKDQELRDNPIATKDDHEWDRNRGQRPVHNANHPDVHELLQQWRELTDSYDDNPRMLTGSTWVKDPAELATYFGESDELHLPQNSLFLYSAFDEQSLRAVVENWLGVLKPEWTPIWIASNHDLSRFPTRWCEGDPERIRVALTLLLTLPGACILYQGDELGMEDGDVPISTSRDGAGLWRDLSRTPIPWDSSEHHGFTTGTPWLPVSRRPGTDVQAQLADEGSILHHTKRTIARRRELWGDYEPIPSPAGRWSYRRGDTIIDLDFENGGASITTEPEPSAALTSLLDLPEPS